MSPDIAVCLSICLYVVSTNVETDLGVWKLLASAAVTEGREGGAHRCGMCAGEKPGIPGKLLGPGIGAALGVTSLRDLGREITRAPGPAWHTIRAQEGEAEAGWSRGSGAPRAQGE